MKSVFTFYLFVIYINVNAYNIQSYIASPALNVPTSSTRTSTLAVSATYSNTLNATWGAYRVRVNISHNSKAFVTLRLTSPAGTTCTLVTTPGSPPTGYRNFEDTWFRDDAAISFATFYGVTSTYRHHTPASWIPQTTINSFNNGQNPTGTWTLTIINNNTTFAGTLNSWEIEFRDTPGGNRTSSAWVTNSETGYPAYNDCATPKKLNKYHNYYGRTRLTYSGNATTDPSISSTAGMPWKVATPNFNTNSTLDNTIWFSFKTDPTGGNVNVLFSFINRNAGTSIGYQAVVLDPGASPCVAANWARVSGTAFMGDNAAGSNPYDVLNVATVGNITVYNSMIKCTGLTANKEYYVCIDGNGAGPASDIEFQIEATGNVVEDFFLLPVELTKLQVVHNNYNNILTWQTASEENNNYFEIEKSTNAIDFKSIATIPSKSKNNQARNLNYYFEDGLSTAYYRLKQVDNDGKSTYSKIVFIEANSEAVKLKVFPNPSNGIFTIANQFNENSNLVISIYDLFGRKLMEKITITNAQDEELNLSDLDAGWYQIIINNNGKLFQEKVLIND